MDFKGIHDRFLRDHVFRRRMIENNRDEKVCRAWFVLANEDHTYHVSEEESTTCKFGGSLSISQETTPNDWENVLISTKRCLHQTVYIKKLEGIRSSPFRIGRTNNGDRQRVLPLFDGNDKIPGGFPKNSKKIKKKDACKGLRSNGATRCLQIFGENLRRMTFTNSFYFVTDRSFTADGGPL